MFSIKLDKTNTDFIARFLLLKEDEEIGNIDIRATEEEKSGSMLDLFIKEEHRKRWLAKNFAHEIVKVITSALSQKGIERIYTIPDKHVPRLVAFFGFKRYNNEHYFYLETRQQEVK